MYFNGFVMKVHRVVFFLCNDYYPKVVMHTCDNPPCVNPDHLQGGTQVENGLDAKRKGRLRFWKLERRDK